MKTFAVVNFKNDNTVEPVPSTWVTADKSKCYWPKKNPKKSELRNPESRPEPDWTLLEIKFIKSYDTYEKASEKADRFKYDSDVDTSEGENQRRKRKLSTEGTAKDTDVFVPPGNIHFGIQQHSQHSLQLVTSLPPAPQSVVTTQGSLPLIGSDIGTFSSNEDVSGLQDTVLNDGIEHLGLIQPVCLATQDDISELRQELRDFQSVTITKLEDLKQRISDLGELLQAVLSSQSTHQNKQQSRIFQLVPVKTLETFSQLESELEKEGSYNELVCMLARIGGPTSTQHVYNILKHMFSKQISTQLRLTATTGKVALKDSLVAKAIRESIHRGNRWGTSSNDTKVNADIGRWFRNQGYVNTDKKDNANTKEHEKQADSSGSKLGSDSDSEEENSAQRS